MLVWVIYIWRGMNQADAGISNLYGGLDINVNEKHFIWNLVF